MPFTKEFFVLLCGRFFPLIAQAVNRLNFHKEFPILRLPDAQAEHQPVEKALRLRRPV
jgi:hypothetical protein